MQTDASISEERLQRDLRYICFMGIEGRRPMNGHEPVEAEVLQHRGYIDDKGGITPQGRQFMLSHQH